MKTLSQLNVPDGITFSGHPHLSWGIYKAGDTGLHVVAAVYRTLNMPELATQLKLAVNATYELNDLYQVPIGFVSIGLFESLLPSVTGSVFGALGGQIRRLNEGMDKGVIIPVLPLVNFNTLAAKFAGVAESVLMRKQPSIGVKTWEEAMEKLNQARV